MIEKTRKEELLRSMAKLEAYQEIQNEMGRTIAAFNFRQPEKVLEHFALEEEGVSLEVADEGVFKGKEAVETIVREVFRKEALPGEMTDVQLTTPIIEVAEDGKTARAVWWCPGAGAIPKEDGDPQAVWLWGDIAADFIFLNGEWKIWHLHYFRFMKCAYEKGWVEDTSMINRPNTAMHPLAQPTTYHNPYHPKAVRYGIPAAPYKYETYTDDNWMLRNDKTI